jgi:hypothetical protein
MKKIYWIYRCERPYELLQGSAKRQVEAAPPEVQWLLDPDKDALEVEH